MCSWSRSTDMVMENKPCCWQHPGPHTLDSAQPSPGQSCDPNWAWDRVKRVPDSSCFYSWHRQHSGTISKFTVIKIQSRLDHVRVCIKVMRRSSKCTWPCYATAAELSCAIQPQFLKRRGVPALARTSSVPSQGCSTLGVHHVLPGPQLPALDGVNPAASTARLL